MNPWPLNFYYWSYVIYITHLVLNEFVIDIPRLSLYCVIVTALRTIFLSYHFNDRIEILNIYWIY